ncbi:hypothetical protein [Nocardia asteroides]|uniref:hypothetical protein n=1 Tax=Nocardia asteroides TaxID=1824 RepID=UPI001E4BBCBD|nr:hypothetical protein [Nocardia asteroides]UGT63333.1 hypothetical protein LTT61_08500 [Nocardia asteroides]
MPDEDSGDVFLHHRALLLDTLLADPALAGPGRGAPDPEQSGPVSVPLRSSGGPKASERILALLNGEQYEPEPPPGLANVARSEQAADPEPEPDPEPRRPRAAGPLTAGLALLRRPKVAVAAAAALVLALILTLVSTGGRTDEQAAIGTLVVTAPPLTSAPSTSAVPGTEPIEVKSAQSKCPPGSTAAMDAFSGLPEKAWSCVRAYKVDGQVLMIDLGRTYEVDSIGIVPGWDSVAADGTDQWNKFRTVSRVSYQFDDGNSTVYTQQTLNQRTLVVTPIRPALRASRIVLTVLQSSGDAAVNTTAISSVVVTGR